MNWKILALAGVVVIAAAAGGGYYMFGDRLAAHPEKVAKVEEAPLPVFLEVKPFVVSMVNAGGSPHYVQIGINFTVAAAAVGNLVTALMPEVTDALRQTALRFKVEDVVTPAGLDKLRKAMIVDVNKVLVQRLGADRVERAAGGDKEAIRNLYFTTLVVE